jgi:Flp pilus assembly protein TadD
MSRRTRFLLLGLLSVAVLAWLVTIPYRRHLTEETARINRETEQTLAQQRQQQRAQTAVERARQAAESAPDDVSKRLTYAAVLMQTGSPSEAETQLRVAARLAPKDAEPVAMLGELYDSQRKLDLAIEAYKRALALDPHNVHALKNLAFRYVSLGWNRDAEALLSRAVQEMPDEARLHIAWGLAAFQRTDHTTAERELREALRLTPNNPAIYPLLAQVYQYAQKDDEALQIIEEGLPRVPDRTLLLMTRARVYLHKNDPDSALRDIEEVLRLDPGSAQAHHLRGLILRKKGDIVGATRDLEWVHQQEPTDPNTMLLLGQLLIQQGRAEEGRKLIAERASLTKAAEDRSRAGLNVTLKPHSPDAHLQLGQDYLAGGDYPRAIVEFKRVLELRPQDREARSLLARALQGAGRAQEAAALNRGNDTGG